MPAKAWAHTAKSTRDKYKTIFVYDVEKDDSSSYHIIMNTLGEYAYKVMKSSEVIDFVIQEQRAEDAKYQNELALHHPCRDGCVAFKERLEIKALQRSG